MSIYMVIRYLHITCAIATLISFALRGFWMLRDSPLLKARLTRVLPHFIDTVLLVSAIALVIMSRQYPVILNWISLKILFLLFYIVFGTFALKRGKTLRIRASCLIAALFCIGAIFTLALTRPVI